MSLAKSLQSKLAALISLAIVASAILVMAPAPAQAAGNAELRWIGQYSGDSELRVYGGNEATVGTAKTAIPGDRTGPYVWRVITTDGSYLYYAIGAAIMKSNLDGTNVTTLTNAVGGAPQGLYYFSGKLYYSSWNNGIYSIPTSGSGSAVLIMTASTNVLETGVPSTVTSGWSGLAVDSTGLYFAINNGGSPVSGDYRGQGLYKAAWNGTDLGVAAVNPDAASIFSAGAGTLAVSAGYLYVKNATSVLKVAVTDWSAPIAGPTWSVINLANVEISVGNTIPANSIGGFSISGSSLYFTSGYGQVGVVSISGGTAQSLYWPGYAPSQSVYTAFGIVVIPTPEQSVTFDPNGGTGTGYSQSASGAAPLLASSFTRPGHTLSSWNTAAGGGGTSYTVQGSYPFGSSGSSVTLYAQWTPLTVSFNANGGTGTMASQSSTTAITLANNTTITKPNHVFSGWNTNSACGVSGTPLANSATYAPTADITLYACWTGEIAVSLAQDGATITAYDFGSVAVGTTNSVTLYLKNIGATSSTAAVLRNASYSSGLGLTAGTPATCNFASGQLTFGNSCTTTIVWSPTAAQTLTPSASLLSFDGAASYSIQFSGAAAVNKVVTYDANGGTGTMASQSAISARNLTSNTVTRPNYTFGGWNTIALGGGTAYADGASYGFGSDLNLFAQWTLIPVSSGPSESAPEIIGVSTREFTDADPQIVTVLGRNFGTLLTATVNGVEVKVLATNNGEIKLDLGKLPAGTYSITLNFAYGSVVHKDAVVVTAKASGGTGALPSGLVAIKVLPGFWGDSALLTAALKSQIQTFLKKVPSATTLLCTGSTSNSRVTARDTALAKSRALAACTFAKSQKPALKTKIAINPSSGLGIKARNVSLKLSN